MWHKAALVSKRQSVFLFERSSPQPVHITIAILHSLNMWLSLSMFYPHTHSCCTIPIRVYPRPFLSKWRDGNARLGGSHLKWFVACIQSRKFNTPYDLKKTLWLLSCWCHIYLCLFITNIPVMMSLILDIRIGRPEIWLMTRNSSDTFLTLSKQDNTKLKYQRQETILKRHRLSPHGVSIDLNWEVK